MSACEVRTPGSDDADRADLRTDPGLRRAWIAHAPELRRFAAARLRDRHRAEDAVQETFLRAWRAADRFDPERGSLRTWLFGIMRNLLIDVARANVVRQQVAMTAIDVEMPDGVDATLDALVVADAIESLSPMHREVVVAAYLHEQPHGRVAELLHLPVGTVRSRLFYARKTLAALCADTAATT
jgi:RNA polymerase sigma-70 factor (ECF subfamily)